MSPENQLEQAVEERLATEDEKHHFVCSMCYMLDDGTTRTDVDYIAALCGEITDPQQIPNGIPDEDSTCATCSKILADAVAKLAAYPCGHNALDVIKRAIRLGHFPSA